MKKYEFVSVKFSAFGNPKSDLREIITSYADKGYKYVGYVPSKLGSYGGLSLIDLIFEIESDF